MPAREPQRPGDLLLLGATSDIGGEIAQRLCSGRRIHLAARRPEALNDLDAQLRARGATEVIRHSFEATDAESLNAVLEAIDGPLAYAVVCFGILGDQERAECDAEHAVEIATVDYTAQLRALTELSSRLLTQGTPSVLVAFSSIAGWRARRANYVYGSTKAGLDAFCQGLMDRLHGSPVQLILARPGFVIGSMTEGMSPAPMSVYPSDVAEAVVEASRGSRSRTLWIPARLRVLAWIMRCVPRPVWRRMPR